MYSVVTCKMDRYVNMGLYIQSYVSYTFEKKNISYHNLTLSSQHRMKQTLLRNSSSKFYSCTTYTVSTYNS